MNIDRQRGERAADTLYWAFKKDGVRGQQEMPEIILPEGVKEGSLEHIFFITLTVAIDYQRDTHALWASSQKAFEDEETRYLFYPVEIADIPGSKITADLQKHGLLKNQEKDAHIWRTVALSFLKRYNGNPVNLFKQYNWYANVILDSVRNSRHQYRGKEYPDFPHLRGDKTSLRWLKMLRDSAGLSFLNMDRIPVSVDAHVARSTLSLGILRGRYVGELKPLFEHIKSAWFLSVKGLKREDGKDLIALDMDEPLWHLSKNGCVSRDQSGTCGRGDCVVSELCVPGQININSNGRVQVNT